MSSSKLGRLLSLAWFFLVRVLVGVIVGVDEENGNASAKGAKVESAPRGGERPWQVLVLWPPQGDQVATRGGVSWRLNCQSWEPVGLGQPERTAVPKEFMTSTCVLVKVTV